MCLNKEHINEIVSLLRKQHGVIDKSSFIVKYIAGKPLFEFIIAVILSQNTSDVNAIKAYNNLLEALGEPITPSKVLVAPRELIINSIRVAGIHYTRYLRIIELAKLFSNNNFTEELIVTIEKTNVEYARKKLMELPGIGSKTADVILLMYFNKPTFPVDTHISRITKRLLNNSSMKYEDIRKLWMESLEPRDYLEVHLLLIAHGREICLARKPNCSKCLLNKYCKYYVNQ